jgi:hypothetical protein
MLADRWLRDIASDYVREMGRDTVNERDSFLVEMWGAGVEQCDV